MKDSAIPKPQSLDFKCEGENEDGVPVGIVTYSSGKAVFGDGRWVTITQALRLARGQGVELVDS